jgi:ABC-type Fe3+-hydroxamate transport system substrate-binding protein
MPWFFWIAVLAFPAYGHRLASTSPQTTELLFQLGLGPRVVARVDGSDFPEAAKAVESLGSLFSPSVEKVLALRPSLVVLDSLNLNTQFLNALHVLGIPTFIWKTDSPEVLLEGAAELFEKLSLPLPEIAQKWRRCLSAVETPPSVEATFLGFVWWDPAIAMGNTSFLGRLFEKVGWKNQVPPSLKNPFPTLSVEWLLTHRPQRLFVLAHSAADAARAAEKAGTWWPHHSVPLTALPSEVFARASFSAFEGLRSLDIPIALPRSCDARP